MKQKLICGVYAALLTPRTADDSVDVHALTRQIRFLTSKGLSAFAVNGATGEFCITTPDQLRLILSTIREASEGETKMLCGVGAASTTRATELAIVAAEQQVTGLLLPMPYFFPYQQEDLDAFCREVAGRTSLPTLLYNLPQFTSGLTKETVRRLITEVPNIIGIKDSSGSLDILRDLTQHGIDACRIVGNDGALCPAMREEVLDGVVSGVACVLPELIQNIFSQHANPESKEFAEAEEMLDSFIQQLNPFPTPWGLKWIAEARGVSPATFSQPVTAHRKAQAAELLVWFNQHQPHLTAQFARTL